MNKVYMYECSIVERLDRDNSVMQLMFESRISVLGIESKIKELNYNSYQFDDLEVMVKFSNNIDWCKFKLLPFGYAQLMESNVKGVNFYIQSLLEYTHNEYEQRGLSLLDLKEFVEGLGNKL